ncbi:MAG: LuxR C-terminal-related transcriptional regulator [Alkalispirochaeta sp.]
MGVRQDRYHATVLLAGVLVAVCVASAPTQEVQPGEPSNRPGVIDFRTHTFPGDGIVELNGEWLIFWNQLVPVDQLAGEPIDAVRTRSDGPFRMPHTWNGWSYNGRPVGGHGYATFVADVLLPDDLEEAALWIPNASTAYALWADGELVARSGTPGTDIDSSIPRYILQTTEISPKDGPTRLVLHVSNFHHRRGGMWKAIKLGTPAQIQTLDVNETAYDLLLLGSFFALGLFNLFLYYNQKTLIRESSDTPMAAIASVPLLLAVTFFALTVRVIVTGQIMLTQLLPSFPWAFQLRLEYVSAMVVFALFSLIASRAYENVVPKIVIRGILVFVLANATVALLFPVNVYSRVVTSYNIIKSVVLMGMTIRFVVYTIRGHRDGWPMVGAIVIFLMITLGETLHYREVVLSRDFAPVGFLVSIFFSDPQTETMAYIVSTMGTLVLILIIFNWFAVRVSLAFLGVRPAGAELNWESLAERYGVSSREMEIIRQVALGKSNKEIGASLHISEGTVKNHLYRIMKKTGTGNRTEIVARLKGTGE